MVEEKLRGVKEVCGSGSAFAALLVTGSVVAWGHAMLGGDSSAVQAQLQHVERLEAGYHAFAAVRRHGEPRVVTWGHEDRGGDSTAVAHELDDLVEIKGSYNNFAAVCGDGRIVTWGQEDHDVDNNSSAQDRPKNRCRP